VESAYETNRKYWWQLLAHKWQHLKQHNQSTVVDDAMSPNSTTTNDNQHHQQQQPSIPPTQQQQPPQSSDRPQSSTNHQRHHTLVSCRNTRQGKWLIADDQGVVCSWDRLQDNGCCQRDIDQQTLQALTRGEIDDTDTESVTTAATTMTMTTPSGSADQQLQRQIQLGNFTQPPFSCTSCNTNNTEQPNHCCIIFEFCVSCCLHADNDAYVVETINLPRSPQRYERFEFCTYAIASHCCTSDLRCDY
jgi:hypothetical protein